MRGLETAYEGEDYSKERQRSARPRGFDWIGARDIAPGVSIRSRIIASQDNCPEGYHRYTVHRVYSKVADKEPVKVLCTESHSDVRYDAEGHMLKRDCFCCDLYAWLKMEGILDKIFAQDESIGAAVQSSCSVFASRTTLFPMIMQADRVQVMGPDPDKKEYELRPNPQAYNTFVFAVREDDGSKEKPLISQFAQLARANPNLPNPMTGSWFQIGREPRSPVHVGMLEAPSMLVIPNLETVIKQYPKIKTWGQTDNKSKPGSNVKRSYSFAKALVRDSWWGQELVRYGVDYSEFTESPVSGFQL